MIKCEGYKMFRGSALFTPKNTKFTPMTVKGNWLYKPEYDCWYCNGSSFPASAVSNIVDYDEEAIGLLKALDGLTITEENAEQLRSIQVKMEEVVR